MTGTWKEPLDRPHNLGEALRRRAEDRSDSVFATFVETGRSLSYGDLNRDANRFAQAVSEVDCGEHLAIMLPSVPEMLVAQYGTFKSGRTAAVINADFRGPALARTINLTASPILVTSAEYRDAVHAVADSLKHVRTLVVIDDTGGRWPFDLIGFEEFLSADDSEPEADPHPTDIAAVLFTSGTTGVSKGCRLSHRFAVTSGATVVRALGMTESDCVYTPYPLHHYAAAFNDVLPALLVGGRTAVRRRFSASRHWADIRGHGATIFEVIGSVGKILEDAPAAHDDADNPVRLVWGGPWPQDVSAFEARFGVTLMTAYGSTDANNPAYGVSAGEPRGSLGFPVPLFELRVADEYGEEVAPLQSGELLIRGREPGLLSSGYLGMPEATVEAWRDLWYHTGDVVRFDDHGRLWYLGRHGDRLRRGGENVSAFEVEEVLHLHAAVQEAAVIGVPSGLGEQLIKAYVRLEAGASSSPQDLTEHCRARLARFMVPDVIEFIDELPRTQTGKVAKGELRALSGALPNEADHHHESIKESLGAGEP